SKRRHPSRNQRLGLIGCSKKWGAKARPGALMDENACGLRDEGVRPQKSVRGRRGRTDSCIGEAPPHAASPRSQFGSELTFVSAKPRVAQRNPETLRKFLRFELRRGSLFFNSRLGRKFSQRRH